MLQWKANLKAVGDNPDYIEDKIASIQKELKKDRPFTPYLREKAEKILEWVDEIDLAERRARERAKMKRVM